MALFLMPEASYMCKKRAKNDTHDPVGAECGYPTESLMDDGSMEHESPNMEHQWSMHTSSAIHVSTFHERVSTIQEKGLFQKLKQPFFFQL